MACGQLTQWTVGTVGWLALPLEARVGGVTVGTFASATAPTRCRETPRAAAAAAASPPRGAARLFKRAPPTRVNQFPSLVARVRQRVGLLLVSRVTSSHIRACVLVSDRRLHMSMDVLQNHENQEYWHSVLPTLPFDLDPLRP